MARKKKQTDILLKIVFPAVVAIICIRLIGSFFTESRLWGVNQAGYVTGMFALYPVLLIAAYWLYRRGNRTPLIFKAGGDIKPIRSPRDYLYPILIAVAATAGFYFLSVRTHFLGDGYQLISNLAQPNLILKSESIGDMKLHQFLAGLLGSGDKLDVYYSFKYLSIISGILFIATLLIYGQKITTTRFGYYTFILLNLFLASTILFFGYVETYSIASGFLFLFLISAAAALYRGRRSIIPLFAFPIAVIMHKISLIYFPAYVIYLFFIISRPEFGLRLSRKIKPLMAYLAIIILVVYAAIVVFGSLSLKTIFLPPLSGRFTTDGYFLFSIKHIVDLLNIGLFLAPVSFLAFFVKSRITTGPWKTGAALFLMSACVSGLMVAILIEPKLGMARDWDLMSVMFIGIQAAGICLWVRWFEKHPCFQPASLMLIILSLAVFIPWLAVNLSQTGMYTYSVRMMSLDPKHGRSGLYSIIPIIENQGSRIEAERLRRYCAINFPEIEMHKNGERCLINGDLRKAESYLDLAIQNNPGFFRSYQTRARIRLLEGQNREAVALLEIADALNPYSSDNAYYTGQAYLQLEDTLKALSYFQKSLAYDRLNPLPYMLLTNIYLNQNQPDTARQYYLALPDSVEIFPETANYELGCLGLLLEDRDRAMLFFDRYLKTGSDSALLERIRIIKESMGK